MRQKIRENLRTVFINPKFTVLIKKEHSEDSWLHNAGYHNLVKQMGMRSESFEGMRLIVELAVLNCFLLLYHHAPGRISGSSNHTEGFLPKDSCTVHIVHVQLPEVV